MNKLLAVCGVVVMTALPCIGQAATPSDFVSWAKMVSVDNNSPAAAEPGDHQMHWTGPDGRRIQLTVKTPRPLASAPTVTLAKVPEGADARPYFDDALAKVRATKAGRLVIPLGTYVFKTMPKGKDDEGMWMVEGLTDVTIDGGGATLVFMLNKNGIWMKACQRVAITNLVIEYGLKMGALGSIVAQGSENVLKVDADYPVTASDTMGHISEYDRASKTFVPGGKRVYSPPGGKDTPKYVGDQTYTSAAFQTKGMEGKSYVIFQQWYGGTALLIKDNAGPRLTEDIILSGVTIHSGPGMGIVAFGMKRGLGIWNCKITPKEGGLISTEYDAIHVAVASGDISIHDNLISGQGDDGINLSNPVIPVSKIDEDGKSLVLSTYSRFIQAHDKLAAFDELNKYLGTAEVVDTPKPLGGPNNQWNGLTLSTPITGLTLKSLFRDNNVVDSRVAVVHNTIRDCQCHGLLVQVPNALVADNTFSNTSANPIRLLTSVGYFKEGVGAINVLVRNNQITGSGIDAGIHAMRWAAIAVYGNSNAGVTAEPSNRYINIEGNSVVNAQQGCISVASGQLVNITGNVCKDTNLALHKSPSISVSYSNDVTVKGNQVSGMWAGGVEVDPATTKDVHVEAQ